MRKDNKTPIRRLISFKPIAKSICQICCLDICSWAGKVDTLLNVVSKKIFSVETVQLSLSENILFKLSFTKDSSSLDAHVLNFGGDFCIVYLYGQAVGSSSAWSMV